MNRRVLDPLGLAALTVALIIGAFRGMTPADWALVTFASFSFFVSAVLKYRSGA